MNEVMVGRDKAEMRTDQPVCAYIIKKRASKVQICPSANGTKYTEKQSHFSYAIRALTFWKRAEKSKSPEPQISAKTVCMALALFF